MSGGPPHGAACDLPDPGPAEDFEVREVTHEEVPVWYHVYCTRSHPGTTAQTFAEGWGDTRFAPIDQADDTPVHTYYVASSAEAAYMESVRWPLPSSASIGIVRAAVVAVGYPIAVTVPAGMPVVGAAVVTIVVMACMAMTCEVVRRGRRNNDHVRAMTTVSVMRLSLSRSAQCRQCDHGSSAESDEHLFHGSSFEELNSGAPILGAPCEARVRAKRISMNFPCRPLRTPAPQVMPSARAPLIGVLVRVRASARRAATSGWPFRASGLTPQVHITCVRRAPAHHRQSWALGMDPLMPLDPYLLLSLPDHQSASRETQRHGGSPGSHVRCLNSAGRWAVHGTAELPLLVWRAEDAEGARAAAARASKARGRSVEVLSRGDSGWVEGRQIRPFTDASEPALLGYTAHSAAKARRLRNEADKLEAFGLVVRAASTAVDQEAFAEVSRAAAKALRARFGGGSITSAFAWLAGRAGREALESVLSGEVELAGPLSVQEVAEAVELARRAQEIGDKS